MQIKNILAIALLASPTFALPAAAGPSERDELNLFEARAFTVNVATAEAQAKTGGCTKGKSGYPHMFENNDRIHWGNTAKVKTWLKDEKRGSNRVPTGSKIPVRVVYMEGNNGEWIYCGVMIHKEVESDNTGKGLVNICS
ncbi:uncharacterized protein BO95DRAFT_430043 [Aspergillus brunneoviolaceus CBS 621.78]|uniref:Uncharacterized protein n=1 Tax=Aspergillus brunneoviolaceus CBS 621.78 TaxID=1450534 RepID=A0ACD1GET2_9EURO|nr:hypothetical protein BO95DRAFT_430043 [Aspergillus brunneoviolaceus CBS 621.78]RAH47692.1 hypothetical protein BO95DRAFT_430043 [Aspergillus brunneoviolaceus CBS 621.78]